MINLLKRLGDTLNKITNSFSKLIVLLILCAVCVLLICICICFLSETLCLQANQFEIILTFIGIIGTFIVVTNFQQVQESKELAKKEIEDIKQKATDEIERVKRRQNFVNEFIFSSKEYILASKIIEEIKIADEDKTIFELDVIESSHGNERGTRTYKVKVKDVLPDNDDIKMSFINEDNREIGSLSNLAIENLDSICLETLDIDPLKCQFDNPQFVNWLKFLLKHRVKTF